MLIRDILKIDNQFRTKGLTDQDDLHPISDLVSDRSLDYDLPTLVNKNFDYNKSVKLCNNADEFKKKFYEKYPFLNGLDMNNLFVAGGSIGNIVKPTNSRSSSDVDFFIYGLSVEEANERIGQWVNNVLNCAKKYVDSRDADEKYKPGYDQTLDCEMIRNNNTLLIKICGSSLQLIFRLYKSKSEVLHGFDLGSSAIGFDGNNVYVTSLGKFCYEHSCNIIDSTRRSTTYEHRLEKYFKRGFNIVLPSLNLGLLRRNYFKYNLSEVCELPHFVFTYSDIVGNKIIVKDFYNKYSDTSDYKLEDIDEYNAFHTNMYNIVNNVDFFYYTSTDITSSTDYMKYRKHEILSKGPRLSKGSVISFYEVLKKDLNHSKIDVMKLKRYIPTEKASVIAKNMVEYSDSDYLENLINKQIQLTLEKVNVLKRKNHSEIHWIVDNPGTQLCGSFNPIFKDESEWYGEYYTPLSPITKGNLTTDKKIFSLGKSLEDISYSNSLCSTSDEEQEVIIYDLDER